jgi:hypothetical protein
MSANPYPGNHSQGHHKFAEYGTALLVFFAEKSFPYPVLKMNDINSMLNALDGLVGKEAAAPLKWQYEQARAKGIILLPPPHPIQSYGEYELGEVLWNNESMGTFGLYDTELPQHIGIFGRTGAGKTNCAFLLLGQHLKAHKPFLVFDWKQTYRPLSSAHSISLYTPGNSTAPFFLNPFDLTNIPKHCQQAYLRQLLSVILSVYFQDLKLLSVEGAEYLLLRGIDYLSKIKPGFTFRDLFCWILSIKTSARERDWKSTVQNVLYKLTSGPIGETLNSPNSLSIEQLTSGRTILELHWLGSPKDKSFLTQLICLQLYYHFSQKPAENNLRFSVFIEEAHNVLLRHLDGYETVLEMVLRQIREYGVGLFLLDQHPSLMSLPALGTFCTIAFNLRTKQDIDVMASSLGLYDDSSCLGQLQTGQAIVKLQDRFLKPFLVGFSLAQTPKKVNRDFPVCAGISGEIPRISPLSGKEAKKPVCDFPVSPGISPEFSRSRAILRPDKLKEKKENPMRKFLKDILVNPIVPTVQRYKRFHLGTKQGNKLKDLLLKNSFISPVKINAGKVRIKLFDVTEAGRIYLQDQGINTEKQKRKGSLVHQYWCVEVSKKFKQAGYTVKDEYSIGNGKAIDIVAEKEKKRIAVEIETGKSDVIGNVEKCLGAGFEKVVVVAVDKKVVKILNEAGFEKDQRVIVVSSNEIRA